MYKLLKTFNGDFVVRTDENSVTTFPLNHNNADYQQFKKDLQSGSTLIDSDNNNMSEEQIKTFLETLE
jgi:hypothetical protein